MLHFLMLLCLFWTKQLSDWKDNNFLGSPFVFKCPALVVLMPTVVRILSHFAIFCCDDTRVGSGFAFMAESASHLLWGGGGIVHYAPSPLLHSSYTEIHWTVDRVTGEEIQWRNIMPNNISFGKGVLFTVYVIFIIYFCICKTVELFYLLSALLVRSVFGLWYKVTWKSC